jgi:hypothetical protein
LNEIAGFIIAVVGVIYAVLLASIAILVIEKYNRAEHIVETEASLVSDLYRDAAGLPEPAGAEVRSAINDYLETVIETEWPAMKRATPQDAGWQDRGWADLENLVSRLSAVEGTGREVFLAEMLRRLNDLNDARRARMFLSEDTTGVLVWLVVIAGAFTTVSFALVFGVPNARGHLLLTNLLALSIALVLVLMVVLDRPFVGADGLSPEPFEYVRGRLAAIATEG